MPTDERRCAIWAAMAATFENADVRPWLPNCARAMFESGYSNQELRHIWVHEVAPQGIWAMFAFPGDTETPEINEVWAHRMRFWNRIFFWSYAVHNLMALLVRKEWKALESMAALYSTQKIGTTNQYFILLRYTAYTYFEQWPPNPTLIDGQELGAQLLHDADMSAQDMTKAFHEDLRPVYLPLLSAAEIINEPDRANRVRHIIVEASSRFKEVDWKKFNKKTSLSMQPWDMEGLLTRVRAKWGMRDVNHRQLIQIFALYAFIRLSWLLSVKLGLNVRWFIVCVVGSVGFSIYLQFKYYFQLRALRQNLQQPK